MSIIIKDLSLPEIGKYDVTVFDDPISKSRKIMINKHLKDEHGRVVGDYPMFEIQELPKNHGRLIDVDDIDSIIVVSEPWHHNLASRRNTMLEGRLKEIAAPVIIEAERDSE